MMVQDKKFISPGAWFTMVYPAGWSEFEDGEDSFLFYNPNNWTGNFRISAYKGDTLYGKEAVHRELKENASARIVQVGNLQTSYSKEEFEEEDESYVSHFWVAGIDNIAFECSFTIRKGDSMTCAEKIISSLEVRKENQKYPAEIIPVRLSEIYQINEAYEWVTTLVKEELKKDFQGVEEDLYSMQQVMDSGVIAPKKKEAWLAFGIAMCVILANEIDGLEWKTLIDGNREVPVLQDVITEEWTDPMKLVWSRVKAGQPCNLIEVYKKML